MKEYKNRSFGGERALFASHGVSAENCVFADGESPLKQSADIRVSECRFLWRYPLWYCENAVVSSCFMSVDARAPVWYTRGFTMENSTVDAPKGIRRCVNTVLKNCEFTNSDETLWECAGVTLENVRVKGDYFAMNSRAITADGLTLNGKYSFDGCKDVVIRNSRLITKDAFWNSENVTVYDSFISAEYLGWNSENLTLVNCEIESLQGLCFCKNLVMKNCRTVNTTLAFEHSTVDAEITSGIESVFNPEGGVIRAQSIGELIVEEDVVSPGATKIICENIGKRSAYPEWKTPSKGEA